LRLVLGGLAVAALLACAGCVVLGTVLGATLSYGTKATEQVLLQATVTTSVPGDSGLPEGSSVGGILPGSGSAAQARPTTTTQSLDLGAMPSFTNPAGITASMVLTTGQPLTLPVDAAAPFTPTATSASAFVVQPLSLPGPSQSLELTPTTQLTLSSVIFIENTGQFVPDVRFQVRGATGGGVWLTSGAIWLTILQSGTQDRDPTRPWTTAAEPQPRQGLRLRLSFVGANPVPEIIPLYPLDTRASYFSGNEPAAWRTGVPVWGGVRYRNLYPGVDLELVGEGGEYVQRLVVQPGADLSLVRLRIDGAQSGTLESLPAPVDEPGAGDTGSEPPTSANSAQLQAGGAYLRLVTSLGDLSLPLLDIVTSDGSPLPSVAPPDLSPVEGGVVVSSPFFLHPASSTAPDAQRILPQTTTPADPSIHLLYSAFLGQGGNDANRAVAVDREGNAYVTGDTYFPDFPAEPGLFDVETAGSYDALAVKINPTGTELSYVTFLGGSGDESCSGVAVDRAGSAYLAGTTSSADLPRTLGAFDSQHHDGTNGFVVKLGALGTELGYATFLGGDGDDAISAIAVDGAGNAYVTGATDSANFPVTAGAQAVDYQGQRDAFVAKVNGAGTGLAYSTLLGGSAADLGAAIAVDAAGSAYVAGTTQSPDFPTTTGAFAARPGGEADAFVVEVNVDGTGLAYATFLGGSHPDYSAAIAVDGAGNAYVAGATQSPDFPATPWAFDTVLDGGYDAFVVKVKATGTGLDYASFLGGPGDDLGQAIAVDGLGYVYLSGSADSFSLPETVGAFDTSPNGGRDAFVVRLDELGTGLEYATLVGGRGQDSGQAMAVDALGSVYVVGATDSPDFAIADGAWQASDKGYVPLRLPDVADAFLFKLSAGTPFLDLPVTYGNFALAALGNVGDRGPGRVNSWFDHSYPNHSQNNNLARWDGTRSTFTAASPSRIGESWYDGHGGIDFGWDVWNEPIYAAAPGKVIDTVTTCQVGQTSCGNYFGNRVWIDHGNGYATVYAHLKSVDVTRGTVIADPASQPLGIMGNTGRSLGTHLHFGVYYDRNADGQWTRDEVVDPFGWTGPGRDPWGAPSHYLWKSPLRARQVAGPSGPSSPATGDTVLLSPSGLVTVTIPALALDAPATAELWDVPPTAQPVAQWHSTGLAFWLQVGRQGTSATFAGPVTLAMAYRPGDLQHLDPGRLTLYRWDSSKKAWNSLPTAVDTQHHQVIAQTTGAGRFDLHAPLLCPADSTEPDDDHGAALPVAVGGEPASRVFDIQGDVDWFRVEGEAGKLYTVQASYLAAGVSAILRVYDSDSQTVLASSEAPGGPASHVQWRAPIDGSYLVEVSQAPGSAVGCSASYEFSVRQLLGPDGIAIAGPIEGKLSATYAFTATVSPSGATLPVTYTWRIDGGSPVTHTAGLSDTWTFAWTTGGSHSISVTAGNVAGSASGSHSVDVYSMPAASFSASPTVGQVPLEVSFTNTSSGDYDNSAWDFGDGSASRSKNPTHTYETPGTYTVTLTISGPGGNDAKVQAGYITALPTPRGPGEGGYRVYLPIILNKR
jgi:murein DD-endopeptidase MepM/ murein hydrolase activator NlpD